MMTDIVERLRILAKHDLVQAEAADEIERLNQEIKNLKRNIDFVIVDGMAFRSFTIIYKDEK